MAIQEDLSSFVQEALTRGLSRSQIEEVLRAAGWSSHDVKRALGAFAEVDFPIPVPRPKPYLSAREAFLYLVLFTTLYISAYSLGSLAFQFIDRAVPDPAAPARALDDSREIIRWSVSSLIVAFPVFLCLSIWLGRSLRLDPTKRASKVRKWLTYTTLFVAAWVIIGDLIMLLDHLLGGEPAPRFLLKTLTVGVIAGAIFGHYLWELRQEEPSNP
jgi:hypothetical protein